MVRLRGTTWNHPRGYAPLRATARSYQLIYPDVDVQWEVRSLQDLADFPIETLAETYDLVNLDHPSVGTCNELGCLLPLDELISASVLKTLEAQSVGPSHLSYSYDGHQWALAIDAASHVSVFRADLFERHNKTVPRSWDQVLALAEGLHKSGNCAIAIPLIPVDSLMCFYTLCASMGEDPFSVSEQQIVSRQTGLRVLNLMRNLLALAHADCLAWNPIQMLDRMSHTNEVAYCPWLFGYSNYARSGFAPFRCEFSNIPTPNGQLSRGAILGGTGLAISSRCADPQAAAEYLCYVAGAECQRGIYFESGGQPGNLEAWHDPDTNLASHNFFSNTLETLTHAYVRPRYPGYIRFQTEAGLLIHEFLKYGGEPGQVLNRLDSLHRVKRNSTHRSKGNGEG